MRHAYLNLMQDVDMLLQQSIKHLFVPNGTPIYMHTIGRLEKGQEEKM